MFPSTSTVALTHRPSRRLPEAELTFVGRKPISYERACQQHDAYEKLLQSLGATIQSLDVNREHPDGVFIEDTAVVFPECAVIARMSAASRRDEPDAISDVLQSYRQVHLLHPPATMDGGDVLIIERDVLVGLSSRTNREAITQLGAILTPHGYRVVPIQVRDALHLKTAMCAVDTETLLVNINWVDLPKSESYRIVEVPIDEPWGANLIRCGDQVVMASGNVKTEEILDNLGVTPVTLDISEFAKAEGGVTCLSLIFQADL